MTAASASRHRYGTPCFARCHRSGEAPKRLGERAKREMDTLPPGDLGLSGYGRVRMAWGGLDARGVGGVSFVSWGGVRGFWRCLAGSWGGGHGRGEPGPGLGGAA